jgi:Raf kinase inhibitor-like YbhB/YbcL family protein
MNTHQRTHPVYLLAVLLVISGCGAGQARGSGSSPEPGTISATKSGVVLTAAAFKDGETIPAKYLYKLSGQCSGENYSPALAWSGAPSGVQSFAVSMVDPDAGNWVHWVQFNIPGTETALPSAPGGPDLGIKGMNSFRESGYGGPCPPSGTHKYIFTLYALDTLLALPQGATKAQLEAAMQGHILQQAGLTGLANH